MTFEALLHSATVAAILAGWWGVFRKAGRPGWYALIPVYNIFEFLDIVDRHWWWIGVFLLWPWIPLIGWLLVMLGGFVVGFAAAERFGKGHGWALGLVFLPFVFYPMLGFGDAEWDDPDYRHVVEPEPEPIGLLAPRAPTVRTVPREKSM